MLLPILSCLVTIADTLDLESSDPSVHLTVGIDTHIWGLNYASMREFALRRSGIEDKVLITKLSDELYWKLQVRFCQNDKQVDWQSYLLVLFTITSYYECIDRVSINTIYVASRPFPWVSSRLITSIGDSPTAAL